ncbi:MULTISPECIES: serine/threonine transporter SstT [Cetobacterium]|jgi:serine/threonine transporter|uniref:Serine/threonine transporter SstT n=1 Tax=Candidatus Cetobacterium colombiensis TaxID=3073100 RepID=A0ABU4W9B5_9FUSO|nr:serine/threonine transporter SstT [Candidatus Cetobacterium colombiensis]MDX8335005.1 serine/threonine transporter SstT [Candidatus Cetobacterium colombiensis]
MEKVLKGWCGLSLVKRIFVGLVLGMLFAYFAPNNMSWITIFGDLFVGALKAIAPVLVFFLVISAIVQHKKGQKTNIKSIVVLYLLGTFLASLVAVVGSFLFPVTLSLVSNVSVDSAPQNIVGVLRTLLLNLIDNPIKALFNGNYIGILFWSCLFGIFLKEAKTATKDAVVDIANSLLKVVKLVIEFTPFGVMGLIFSSISASGGDGLLSYGKILLLLLGCMGTVAFIVNPIIAFIMIQKNPYPLVFTCLRESGLTAFFTRSSAANIPVNMNLCEKLGLEKDMYSVSIPLGATINMAGAAVTISVFALSAAHTLGIQVDFISAIVLSLLSAISACGASGVAGGSLLLIPLACSLFGISNDVAMQVVGVGFVIGVVQDSCETALNSSTDVLFTSIAEFSQWKKEGKEIELSKI